MSKEINKPELIKVGSDYCIIQVGNSFVKEAEEWTKLANGVLDFPYIDNLLNTIKKNTEDGAVEVYPFGHDNRFPSQLFNLIKNDYKALQLNNFNAEQIYGAGPIIINKYSKAIELESKASKEVVDWLETWEYKSYLQALIADYASLLNCFTGVKTSIAGKYNINANANIKIHSLYHYEASEVRLGIMDNNGKIDYAVVGDWDGVSKKYSFVKIPIFDINNPTKHDISIIHAKRKVSGYPYYSYPSYFGVLNIWLPVANAIPLFHKSLLENGINAKYHIEISKEYIDSLVNERRNACAGNIQKMNSITVNSIFNEQKKKITDELKNMMSGSANAGKFFASKKIADNDGKSQSSITITPIENKIKELSEAHLKLNEQVNSEYCSAFSVDPNLASITIGSGKMSSGSDKINSFNVHQQTKTIIPREVVLKAVNQAIKINFPDSKLELAFKPIMLVKQEENKNGVL